MQALVSAAEGLDVGAVACHGAFRENGRRMARVQSTNRGQPKPDAGSARPPLTARFPLVTADTTRLHGRSSRPRTKLPRPRREVRAGVLVALNTKPGRRLRRSRSSSPTLVRLPYHRQRSSRTRP